jgi:hypothetical protein
MGRSRGLLGQTATSLGMSALRGSEGGINVTMNAALCVLQRPALPDCKDRASTRPAIVPGDPQGRRMKPIHNKAFCSRLSHAEQILCVQISRIMTHYHSSCVPVVQSLSRTAISLKQSEKLGGSAASASDHRGACRASNRPFHPLSFAKPLE